MPTCKECEWFIHFESGKGVCCCPDRPKNGLPKHFPYKNVTVNTPACNFFSKEEKNEMLENKDNEKVIKESKVMAALEEHNSILEDVEDFINQLFQKFKPVLEEGVFTALKQVNVKLLSRSGSASTIPLVRKIQELDSKLIKIAEYLQTLLHYTGF